MENPQAEFVQIVVGQWSEIKNSARMSFTLFGLDKDGKVYRFIHSRHGSGWRPEPMNILVDLPTNVAASGLQIERLGK